MAESFLRHARGQSRLARDDDVRAGRRSDRSPWARSSCPDGSYREMTEWALPSESLRAFRDGADVWPRSPDSGDVKRFFRAGGNWRNFKARYPESDEMYARMLGVSRRLGSGRGATRRPTPITWKSPARSSIAAQCNCPYWHGSFGGLYLPHLQECDLPQPDRRPQRTRRRRGPHGAACRDRGRRLQPRRPPGSPPRKRPADRLGAARARRATSTSSTSRDSAIEPPGDARSAARGLPRRHHRSRGRQTP